VLDGESDVLINPTDDRTKSAFDPSVQGRTDQFVLRFRKPL
jgi:predicted methyltransferase